MAPWGSPLLTLFSGVQVEAITTIPVGPRRGRSWSRRWWVRGVAILLKRGVRKRPESQPLPLPEVNSEPLTLATFSASALGTGSSHPSFP